MFYKRLVAVAIILALFCAVAAEFTVHLPTAYAAGSPHYSISHYVNFTDYNTTDSMLKNWAKQDASRMDPPGDAGSCPNNYYGKSVVVVLDFGSLQQSGGVYGESNWQNFHFFDFGAISNFAFDYALAYYENSGVCTSVWVAIGTNNADECSHGGIDAGNPNCVYWAGYYLGSAVEVAQQDLNNQGGDVPKQMGMAGGDDIEYDGYTTNWDTYVQTTNALGGFINYPDSFYMIDYGYTTTPCDAISPRPQNCGSGRLGSNGKPIWDSGETYNVAWGLGKDVPLPEAYNQGWGTPWGQVYRNSKNGTCSDCINGGTMYFWGVMSENGWNDGGNGYQYARFWREANNPQQNSFYWDTCMPYGPFTSPPTSPCY
jgi:hypothetical protein